MNLPDVFEANYDWRQVRTCMLTEYLYKQVLLEPLSSPGGGNDELFIVSGYASATFLQRHFFEALKTNPAFKLNLIIGMKYQRRDHAAYASLIARYPDFLSVYYYTGSPEVHAKSYCWSSSGELTTGFTGSANYSQYGFFSEKQLNQMTRDNPIEIRELFDRLLVDSVPVSDHEPHDEELQLLHSVTEDLNPGEIKWVEPDRAVRISLLARDGSLGKRSGLNWGARIGREPNQAYLTIRKSACKEGFLPDKKYTFTLLTDDNKAMDCTVQQDGRKAISTTENNSIMGRYFRDRLNVPHGAEVTKAHLMKYGRTDILLTKLDKETFHMDFSQPKPRPVSGSVVDL